MRRRPPIGPIVLALGVMSAVPTGAEVPAPPTPFTALVARAPGGVDVSGETELERMLARVEQEERDLEVELARIGPELDITRRRMLARARAHYRHLRAGFLPVGAGFDALVDYAAEVERTRRALLRDREAEAALVQRSAVIGEKLAHLQILRAPLEVQREALNRARMALRQADEREAAFARAFETSVRPPDYMAIYGADTGPSDLTALRGFVSLKGRLPLPVAGRAEARRVERRGAGGPGLVLTAIGGAAARSVAAGRVVFVDQYADYGLTVILDHGDHYYSVYASLDRVDVHVGDTLPSASRIGVVGGAEGRPGELYFELRRRAETIDPAPWLGL